MFQLAGKRAVVTGAGRGIGQAIAAALSQQGAQVAVLDINGELAAATAQELGATAQGYALDIGDSRIVAEVFARLIAAWGGIDLLVNNAATISVLPFTELDEAEWTEVLNVNLTGTYRCCRAVVPSMLAQRGGRIINIASVAAKRGGGLLGTAAYAAAKAGVIGLSRALARELASANITVNTVVPGPTTTQLTSGLSLSQVERITELVPLRRFGTPNEIAAAVVFLASDEAAFVTGTTLDVDGGLMMD
jgi:NAD(P)-dependent dehydrogenase (short-subunit alcohol dehydrogenase family)